jgi:hypothetical protein
MRVTAFITDTPPGAVPGQLAGLELPHRQHARVEDRIRELKAAGLANLANRRSIRRYGGLTQGGRPPAAG